MKSVVVVVILTASCVLVAAPHSLLPGETHTTSPQTARASHSIHEIDNHVPKTFRSLTALLHLHCQGHTKDTSVVAATSILRTHSQCRHAALLLTDGDKRVEAVQAPRGVAVFRAAANGLSDNNTHTHLQETVDQIRQVNVNTEFLH
ncbi:uncharacterized protein LOC123512029 isoform X1 [Portunus trituberculatus]|uniref:uncharacterized protein LOC123512029 isoform X1 n=1 Tax=Portunus trituberculatus TaxID=210409 RepID=UPI001E1D056C|nr:uncharacterized protein LOC123512029 isoform X1 [Portunus trituberculatus]